MKDDGSSGEHAEPRARRQERRAVTKRQLNIIILILVLAGAFGLKAYVASENREAVRTHNPDRCWESACRTDAVL